MMRLGNQRESHAQSWAVRIVDFLSIVWSNTPFRIPHTTGTLPPSLAAKPPNRSAWYIQVWTTAGRSERSDLARLNKAETFNRPRRIRRQRTGMPSSSIRLPSTPLSVIEITSNAWVRRSQADTSLKSIISAPPADNPVITCLILIRNVRRDAEPKPRVWQLLHGILKSKPQATRYSTKTLSGRANS